MKANHFVIAVLAGVLFAVEASAKPDAYRVIVPSLNAHSISIEASLTLRDETLYMEKYGAAQFPRRWAEFVKNLKAADSRGRTLPIVDLGDARWKISAKEGQRIELSYDLELDHEKHKWAGGIDGVAYRRDWGMFLTGRSFLILNGEDRANTIVDFRVPTGWKVTASWQPNGQKINSFTARNSADLSESMIFAGRHEELSVRRDGFELLFALAGPGIAEKRAAYSKLASGVLDYYIALMGGIPKPPPGKEFKRSLVVISSAKEMDGEVIGNHISMLLDPAGDRPSQVISLFIFAHEFFHLWNGKSINVESSKEDWFKEGISSYYPMKALLRTGAVSEAEILGMISGLFHGRYSADPGLGTRSMRDVASGMEKDKHWGLIYAGGLFAGICQDVQVRKATAGRRSLDDLLRNLYRDYAGTNKTYTTAHIRDALSALSGNDQTEFFERYVYGKERVPVEACLNDAGLSAKIEGGRLLLAKKAAEAKYPSLDLFKE